MNFLKKIYNFKDFLPLLENKEDIPFELKKLVYIIRRDLYISSQSNKFPIKEYFDFTKEIKFPISFTLVINLMNLKEDGIPRYEGGINVLMATHKEFKNFDFVINISDDHIQMNKLIPTIHHELRHIYDVMMSGNEYNLISFLMEPIFKKMKDDYPNFSEFFNLAYMSMEHELVARNSMIYDHLRWLNVSDRDLLMDEVKKTRSYQYLLWMQNFDHAKFINSFNFSDLKNMTNKMIELMNKYREVKLKFCLNEKDIDIFYKKWENLFKMKSKEYREYINKIIGDVINDVRPYNENHSYAEKWNIDSFMGSYLRFFSNLI